jgi:uncharacterized protein (TIGR02145 family)
MNRLPVLTTMILVAFFSGCKKDDKKETVTDIDGNVYNTVVIGTQVWMTENLKVTHYRNGDPIPKLTDQIDWQNNNSGAYCNYGNADSNAIVYGSLYNWFAVNDPRKLAPPGWHIPTFDEWFTLQYYLLDYAVAGGKMKKTGMEYWFSPNEGANNSSGFGGMPGGRRNHEGIFSNIRYMGFWWNSTETSSNTLYADYRRLLYNSSSIDWSNTLKRDGLSVRCIKD